MPIFYSKYSVVASELSNLDIPAHDIQAFVWVEAYKKEDAQLKISFLLGKDGYSINSTIMYLKEVNEIDFFGRDIGLENFRRARKQGHAVVYLGVSNDGVTTAGPIELKTKQDLKISTILKIIEKNKNKGRCLHFDAGKRCDKPIKAHSIQKSGLLDLIQEDGHVLCPSFGIGVQKESGGVPVYQKRSVKKVSTFMGFCGKHDNELFHPIDDNVLIPTDEQIAQYSYRSLCREYFVKENAINSFNEIIDAEKTNTEIVKQLSLLRKGFEIGFNSLHHHKSLYDEMLMQKSYSKMQYIVFYSNQKPNIVFSGILYPHFDFIGNRVQILGDIKIDLKMLTFCSAPMEEGWGYAISWMKYNDNICIPFIESFKELLRNGGKAEDLLFRLLLTCENHAVSPRWWNSKSDESKAAIEDRFAFYVDTFADFDPMILAKGLESISDWKFDNVQEKID